VILQIILIGFASKVRIAEDERQRRVNMKARGKRGAKRSASPLGKGATSFPALKERHNSLRSIRISHFQCSWVYDLYQGRRASLRFALAPGFYIYAPLALESFGFGLLRQSRQSLRTMFGLISLGSGGKVNYSRLYAAHPGWNISKEADGAWGVRLE
jgi:hypothetical protein